MLADDPTGVRVYWSDTTNDRGSEVGIESTAPSCYIFHGPLLGSTAQYHRKKPPCGVDCPPFEACLGAWRGSGGDSFGVGQDDGSIGYPAFRVTPMSDWTTTTTARRLVHVVRAQAYTTGLCLFPAPVVWIRRQKWQFLGLSDPCKINTAFDFKYSVEMATRFVAAMSLSTAVVSGDVFCCRTLDKRGI